MTRTSPVSPGRCRRSPPDRFKAPSPWNYRISTTNPCSRTASRALDTCWMGARGLAVLGDPRAFGLLLQLSREDNTQARVEVCRAMAALDDPRALKRLRSLLHDGEASVRDAAFTALSFIHEKEPL